MRLEREFVDLSLQSAIAFLNHRHHARRRFPTRRRDGRESMHNFFESVDLSLRIKQAQLQRLVGRSESR